MKTLKLSVLFLLSILIITSSSNAQREYGTISDPIAEALIEKIKSSDAKVRLEAFDVLGIKEPSMMNLLIGAVDGSECGIEDLERFMLSDAVVSIVRVLKKQRSKVKDRSEYENCEYLLQGSGITGF